jgi:6-phosphogluconolactonase
MRPDCSSAEFFPVDERKTPFEDDASNWGTATRLFLEPVGRAIDQRNHAVDAKTYEKILHERFGSREIVFDTIFLGVGADGHTASLFPGCTCLNDRDSIVLETESPKPPTGRVTLAPRPLLAARKLIVIVAGESKQEAARGILEKDQRLPVVRILSARPESDVYIGASLL